MRGYRSIMVSSTNENGQPEIEAEFHKSWFRRLFRLPKFKIYVMDSEWRWYNKVTGKRVSASLSCDLTDALIRLTRYHDTLKTYTMTQPNGEVL